MQSARTKEFVLEDLGSLAKDPGGHWVICIAQLEVGRLSQEGLRDFNLHAGELGFLIRAQDCAWVHNMNVCMRNKLSQPATPAGARLAQVQSMAGQHNGLPGIRRVINCSRTYKVSEGLGCLRNGAVLLLCRCTRSKDTHFPGSRILPAPTAPMSRP